jgi:hypothetical protein
VTDWNRFPVERISTPTYLKRNLIHLDLLVSVLRRSRSSILEVGIGSGAQSSILSRFAATVVSIDNDARIIDAARPNVSRFGPHVHLVGADAFALPFPAASFGVAVSQGLMEHFDDPHIGALVAEQLRVARSVVFSVPSDRYPRQDVGDERLLPPAEWERLVAGTLDTPRYRVGARYYRFDPESAKYSALARRRLGGFSVLVTVDRR